MHESRGIGYFEPPVPVEGLTSLLTKLRYHNLAWFAPASLWSEGLRPAEVRTADSPLPPEHLGSVLHYMHLLAGDETNEVLAAVRRMALIPQFYRLNWIRQLSTTSLAINLEGSHNRLSHCLGTLDIASRFVRALRPYLQPVEEKAILVYAFVHDCFHGPMGHTMDLIKDVIWGPTIQERIDKHLLLSHIDQGLREFRAAQSAKRKVQEDKSGFLWTAVRESVSGGSDKECQAIFLYLQGFLEGDAKGRTFMAEIVDSDIDADRIDYIWRDHSHLMMASLPIAPSRIENLIDSVVVLEEGGDKHLYFSKNSKRTVEELLETRFRFYNEFYEHPIKMVADEMLTHALYYALQEEGLLDTTGQLLNTNKEFAEEFSYLTDEGLMHFLTDLTAKENHAISHALLQDLKANRLFEIVYKKGLDRGSFFRLTRRYGALNNKLKSIQDEEEEHIREYVTRRQALGIFNREQHAAVIARFNSVATQTIFIEEGDPLLVREPHLVGASLEYTEQDDLYRLQYLYGIAYKKKVLLERLLWRELLARPPFVEALMRVALALAESRPTDEEYARSIFRQLEKTPLVFINLSWIPGITEQELENHKRGYSPGSLRFHERGKPCKVDVELTVKRGDEDYFLTISAPGSLLKSEGMREQIVEIFDRFLKERKWVVPQALEEELFN